MTEEEWLTTTDPMQMFDFLRARKVKVSFLRTRKVAVSERERTALVSADRDRDFKVFPPGTFPHAAIIRDIFGNPFRPVVFDPAWRTSTAVGVAERIYADRTFGDLPILADALQDAGCEHADILAHLRGPGPHVRGCWALDLVLGKE